MFTTKICNLFHEKKMLKLRHSDSFIYKPSFSNMQHQKNCARNCLAPRQLTPTWFGDTSGLDSTLKADFYATFFFKSDIFSLRKTWRNVKHRTGLNKVSVLTAGDEVTGCEYMMSLVKQNVSGFFFPITVLQGRLFWRVFVRKTSFPVV